MNIIVTGCAGFIGSHMVDLLLEEGHNVIGIDCFTYAGKVTNIHHHYDNPNFKIVNCDICNTEKILSWCNYQKIDWVINFAAETHVDNSIKDCGPFIHSNINGVKSLLDVCMKMGTKLFHISTDEVYGSTLNESFLESDSLMPGNPYSATKAAGEHLITSYHHTYGVTYKMVRMSNNFGPRQDSEKFIPTIIRSIRGGKKIPVYGTGENVRDWIFVKDCCRMINDVLHHGVENETYNLSLKNEMKNIDLVREITETMGSSLDDCVMYVKDRAGHDFRYSIDNSKYMKVGSVNPTIFSEAIAQTAEYYEKKK